MFEANMIKPLTRTKSAYVPQNTALGIVPFSGKNYKLTGFKNKSSTFQGAILEYQTDTFHVNNYLE